jgi:hypothetical protein
MRALAAVLLLAVTAAAAPLPRARIATCHAKPLAKEVTAMRPALARIVADLQSAYDVDAAGPGGGIQFRSCPAEPVPGCVGGGDLVYCSEETLERFAIAAAWLAAGAVPAPHLDVRDAYELADAEVFNVAGERQNVVARLARRGIGAAAFARLEQQTAAIRAAVSQTTPAAKSDAGAAAFRLIANDLFALILGHELTHRYGNRCPVTKPSQVEKNGTAKFFFDESLSGERFCNRGWDARERKVERFDLSLDEYHADVCAMRFLEFADGAASAAAVLSPDAVRRARGAVLGLALWAMSFNIGEPLSASIEYTNAANDDYLLDFRNLNGYLLRPFRTLLVAHTLMLLPRGGPSPLLCGETANILKLELDWSLFDCKRPIQPPAMREWYQKLPAQVTSMFPEGVRKAWKSGDWSGDVYACEPTRKPAK